MLNSSQHKSEQLAKDVEKTYKNKLNEIENLLIGAGAEDFLDLETRLQQFCPFEAIGMVRAEIRHAHFLHFLLNPKASHPFQDKLLKVFLQAVFSEDSLPLDNQLSMIEIHLMDCSNAIILREKSRIDLLIEIEINAVKGVVVAVEIKVDATESKGQLNKYRSYIESHYPSKKWVHRFAFLTLDGRDASEETDKEYWAPLTFEEVIGRFDQVVENSKLEGRAVDLYQDYSTMIRRHLMHSKDSEIAILSRRIWKRHRQALKTLIDYEPNFQSELFEWILEKENWEKLTSDLKKKLPQFTIEQDTSTQKIRRFKVVEWLKIKGFRTGDGTWVVSKSLVSIELYAWGPRFRLSFVLGPGDQDNRNKIYELAKKWHDEKKIKLGKKSAALSTNYKHLSSIDLIRMEEDKEEEEKDFIEKNGKKLSKNIIDKLESYLPIYNNLLKEALEP